MPNFVGQLKVPLIALADARTHELIFFRDETLKQHFRNQWEFTSKGFTLNKEHEGIEPPKFEPMDPHTMLFETSYKPYDFAKDEEAQETVENMDTYHIVQTCVPSYYTIAECKEKGQLVVVVGQEIYDQSPFTKEIAQIMADDVNEYYLIIILIFAIVKMSLFCVLWSWLRMRVTDRMIYLTKKLKTSDQADNRNNYQPKKLTKFDSNNES